MNIHKGDNVQITAGKDSGKRGKVVAVDLKNNKVLIHGLNMFKKHQRPKKQGEKGETISVSRYLNASNAMLVCGSCDRPVRVGYKIDGKTKTRYCKKCQSTV